jgi:hypothetical protein
MKTAFHFRYEFWRDSRFNTMKSSITISYQQMHQIHLLFNTVLIIYIKIS